MKPWKHHVLTTHTVCKHYWLIRYETDMDPELSTAAADQNFAWICKQHQDLIGSVLIFRTKIIWSGPEFGLVRCGYLNAAIIPLFLSAAYFRHMVAYISDECFCWIPAAYKLCYSRQWKNASQKEHYLVPLVTGTHLWWIPVYKQLLDSGNFGSRILGCNKITQCLQY